MARSVTYSSILIAVLALSACRPVTLGLPEEGPSADEKWKTLANCQRMRQTSYVTWLETPECSGSTR